MESNTAAQALLFPNALLAFEVTGHQCSTFLLTVPTSQIMLLPMALFCPHHNIFLSYLF